jgi:uncharacterized membrane protein
MNRNPLDPREPIISQDDRLFAALAYLFWPLAVILLFVEPNKRQPFQRYHAVQALMYGVAASILVFVFLILDLLLSRISNILGTVFSCLTLPVWLFPAAAALWFAYRAYQGQMFDVPYLTRFAQQQGWL